jgi:hypothetical protein
MDGTFTARQIDRRAATIMRGVQTGKIASKSDALAELGEIIDALSDQPVKPAVVARLTITRASGRRIIVEVREGSKFASFYRFYGQDGARRSTKKWIRNGSRSEGPNLTAILERMKGFAAESNPVIHSKLRIIKRRAYRKLITARPDELGLTKMSPCPIFSPTHS